MIEAQVDLAAAGMDAEALARLDDSIQADVDAGSIYGATILVGRRGRVVHRAEFGQVADGRPAAPGDKYFLQSMSKAFTAILVLRAVESGRFGLDTTIAELWPAFALHGKTTQTIAQMLCHTAGLPTTPVAPPLPQQAMGELRRAGEAIAALHPVYDPGSRCAYTSGTGYDALGRVLELTDPEGRRFRDIAREELFEPLGLPGISFGLPVDDPARVPVRWTPSRRGRITPVLETMFNEIFDEEHEAPCAGAFATIDDLYRFTEIYHGRGPSGFEFLSPEMFSQARANHTGDLPLEAIPPIERDLMAQQAMASFGPDLVQQLARSQVAQAAEQAPGVAALGDSLPARFTWLGGYVRGTGDGLTPLGATATPTAIGAMGGGSTGWLVDTERDLTVIFLSTGMLDGTEHLERLQRQADLAIAAVSD